MGNIPSREAKLVQLIGNESLNPKYAFSGNSIDFKYPPRDSSKIEYYAYNQNNLDSKEVKNLAMKTFEENYNKKTLFWTRSGLKLLDKYTLEELKELKIEKENGLEKIKIKYFYNPFSESWKKNFNGGLSKLLMEAVIAGAPGTGIYEILAQNRLSDGLFSLVIGITMGTLFELWRRSEKSFSKDKLKSTNQNIQYYDNFRKNIENAEIEIIQSEKAQEIYKELQNPKGLGKFVKLDIDSANEELFNAYFQSK